MRYLVLIAVLLLTGCGPSEDWTVVGACSWQTPYQKFGYSVYKDAQGKLRAYTPMGYRAFETTKAWN